jgi:hypothetical protein
METLKNLVEIIFYASMSISGPIGVYQYFKARRTERIAQEFKVYKELDDRLFEYQKLALMHPDLDILELPGKSRVPGIDRKQKQELIAHAILFSLFERAYLMFKHQSALFKRKQWAGWTLFLNDLLHRESVQTAWEVTKMTFDTDFQQFMDDKIRAIGPIKKHLGLHRRSA